MRSQVFGLFDVPEKVGDHSWDDVPEHLEGAALDRHLSRRDFIRRAAWTAGIGMSLASTLPADTVLAHARRALRQAVPTGDANPIDHFVVLMMENRSFDHYFGWWDPTQANATQHETYNDPSGTPVSTAHAPDVLGQQAEWQGCGHSDPGHGWDQGRAQLAGGFLANGSGNDRFALTYYDEGELGFVHPAAKAFTLYDNYFCSILGPTYVNRYYKWSAQSGGRKDNSLPTSSLGNQWETIFDRAIPNGVTATYFNSDLPFSALWGPRGAAWTQPVDAFYAHCAAGTLPNITFVDPPFRDGGGFHGMSADEHPLGDVRLGQAFMADVVHAFMSSPNFRTGALFIVYDEWGGFFDHVTPPRVPDDRASSDLENDFSQMGFRIPAVVVSPWTVGGGVSHVGPLGHESILKLIEQRFKLGPLVTRDQMATSIGESFDWTVDPAKVDIPDLPHPQQVASAPCEAGGGGGIADPNGAHGDDMAALEDLAHRYGIPVGEGKPHQIFRSPDSVKKAVEATLR